MKRITKASVFLGEVLSEHGAQTRCFERTSIKQDRLSRFTRGELFPRADEAARLQADLGVAVEWWDEPVGDSSTEESHQHTHTPSPQQ